MSDEPTEVRDTDTKKCPYCAETIKAEAVACRFCGRDLATGQPPALVAPVQVVAPVPQPKKYPVIGFAGLLLILAGIGLFCFSGNNAMATIATLAGLGILIYALLTGNIKFCG